MHLLETWPLGKVQKGSMWAQYPDPPPSVFTFFPQIFPEPYFCSILPDIQNISVNPTGQAMRCHFEVIVQLLSDTFLFSSVEWSWSSLASMLIAGTKEARPSTSVLRRVALILKRCYLIPHLNTHFTNVSYLDLLLHPCGSLSIYWPGRHL